MQIRNSISSSISKIQSQTVTASKTNTWLLIIYVVSLQLFDTAFSTFHVRFIKLTKVDETTNAFVKKIRYKLCKRLLHLWTLFSSYKQAVLNTFLNWTYMTRWSCCRWDRQDEQNVDIAVATGVVYTRREIVYDGHRQCLRRQLLGSIRVCHRRYNQLQAWSTRLVTCH